MRSKATALVLILVCLSAGAAWSDVETSGLPGDGTFKGTVIKITHGEGGLKSVTLRAEDETEVVVTNGEHKDIREFGGQLERAYEAGDTVTLKVDSGNLKEVSREKKR